jgi:PASTA domain
VSRRAKTTVIAVTAALLLPAGAAADTVTMGSQLQNDYSGGLSTGNTLTIQQSFQAGVSPNAVVSPANGVVTAWAVKTGNPGTRYTLRILRPSGAANTYLGVGSSVAPTVVPATVAPTGTILNYPAALAINQGDSIGLQQDAALNGVAQFQSNGLTGNVIANNFLGAPADGSSAALIPDQQHELLLQATVKFCKVPDLKGVKTAAAQQLLTAADCAGGPTANKKFKRSKKNKKKKGKILNQTLAAGTTTAPGTPVGFTVAKLKKKK